MSTPSLPEAPPMQPPSSESSSVTIDEVVPTAGGGGDTSSGSEAPHNGVKQSTYDAIDRASSAVSSLDKQWKAFQKSFEQMNEALVENLARSFGIDTMDLLQKDATAEQRHSVFGGKAPSAKQIAAGIKSGKYKNIVVLCGAGMSTSAGIPDFRSPDTGVYAQLKKEQEERKAKFSASKDQLTEEERKQQEQDSRDRELPTPESLFTLDYYRQNQKPFILRAGHMWPGKTCKYRPTPSHCFLKMIEPQLLRIYTQNIDELETCGDMLPRDKVRRCHGSFEKVHCPECNVSYDRGSKTYEAVYQSMVVEGKPSQCAECLKRNPLWAGVMKPGIVFFGEAMSPEFTDTKKEDFQQCDLLIVMGTSLMVTPFSSLPELVSPSVPRLLLNGEVVGPFEKSLKPDSTKIVDSSKATPVAGRNRDMLVTLSKQGATAESKKKGDDPGNYRDCALVGDLDASVHSLAKWMGQEQALASLCRSGQCLNPKPDAGKASKLVPLPAEGSFNPRAAAAPTTCATPSSVASKDKIPAKPRVSPPPANSTTTASRGSVTGPAKPAGKLPPIRGGGMATGKRSSLVPPSTLKVVTEQTTATNATGPRKQSLKPATRITPPSALPNAKKRATSSSIARK